MPGKRDVGIGKEESDLTDKHVKWLDDPEHVRRQQSHSLSTSASLSRNLGVFSSNRSLPKPIMARDNEKRDEENLLLQDAGSSDPSHSPQSSEGVRPSMDSVTSASTTSLVLENLNNIPLMERNVKKEEGRYRDDDSDPELPRPKHTRSWSTSTAGNSMSRNTKRIIWIIASVAFVGWALALGMFLATGRHKAGSTYEYDHESPNKASGKKVTLEQVMTGQWSPARAEVEWIAGPNGEDGLMLEKGQPGKDYLVVEDIRSRAEGRESIFATKTLLKNGEITYEGLKHRVDDAWVSSDFKKVLVLTKKEKLWRHSFTGIYYIVDVATQEAEPLDSQNQMGESSWQRGVRVERASSSPETMTYFCGY